MSWDELGWGRGGGYRPWGQGRPVAERVGRACTKGTPWHSQFVHPSYFTLIRQVFGACYCGVFFNSRVTVTVCTGCQIHGEPAGSVWLRPVLSTWPVRVSTCVCFCCGHQCACVWAQHGDSLTVWWWLATCILSCFAGRPCTASLHMGCCLAFGSLKFVTSAALSFIRFASKAC